MLAAAIAFCEVAFWVFIVLGLTARYLLSRPRLGAFLLVCAPLVDLVLLAASVVDLRNGGEASIVHALAAIYLGVSVGFGHRMIGWADARFAYRFAGGPRPTKPPKYGTAAARHRVADWLRHLLAWSVGSGLMLGGVLLVGDTERTKVLLHYPAVWGIVLLIDAVVTGSEVVTALRHRDDGTASGTSAGVRSPDEVGLKSG
jgi:hypothetical protein